MDTPQEIRDRYKKTVRVTDAFGRSLVVGRLRPSQQLKVVEFSGSDVATGAIRLACMCREIDEDQLGFPRSRAEVDARVDRLEDEGLEAVAKAMAELFGAIDPDADPLDEAKN